MNAIESSEEIKHDTQPKKMIYTAKAHTTGGRDGGASQTSDGRLEVKFSIPGGPGNGTNPEQLFAVGWSGRRDRFAIGNHSSRRSALKWTS